MAKKIVKDKSKIKTTKENRMLKCELTQTELLQAGQDLAEMLDRLRSTTEERESVTKFYKAKEAELETSITTKQLMVRNKYEVRSTPCINTMDYDTLEVFIVRTDTGKEFDRRKMTEDEKQSLLPFDAEKPEDENLENL